jgi:hypothetical protein
MWQRIQTVFLVIAVISLIATIFLPVWESKDEAGNVYTLYALHFSKVIDGTKTTLYLPYSISAILLVASATVAIVEIRAFKNRMLQIKLGALNALFLAGAMGSLVYFGTTLVTTYGGVYGFGMWLPAVAVVFNWLAIRFIKKDERLVRDSDRLR